MRPWRAIGSVLAGAVVTTILTGAIAVALPVLGVAVENAVGSWLPIWVFAIPVILGVASGGAITAALYGGDPLVSAGLGTLAGALGTSVYGVIVGLFGTLFIAGITPAHAEVQLGKLALWTVGVAGATAVVAGGVLGAIGGAAVVASRAWLNA